MKFGDEIIITHRHYRLKPVEYDNYGTLLNNELVFIRIKDPNEVYHNSEEEYEHWYHSKEKITITRNNIPEKIWYYLDGDNEEKIIWDTDQ